MKTSGLTLLITRKKSAPKKASAPRAKRAFTLLEVMLSLAISALVMFGCVALMFNMVSLVEHFESNWSLRSHADGVERFLRARFLNSEFSKAPNNSSANASKTLYLAPDPRTGASESDKFLCFALSENHPFFVSQIGFTGSATCWLEYEDDALYIVWTVSEDSRSASDNISIYKSEVSKWVEKLSYIYEDDDSWEEEDELREGTSDGFPSAIRIYFKRGDEEFSRVISFSNLLDFQISK